jgi:glutamate 5-kinase
MVKKNSHTGIYKQMRILIKIGSAQISKGSRINYRWLKSKVREIAELHEQGNEIILVSSGAVAAGMEVEKLTKRPLDVLKLQLLSGEGQIRLLKYYKDYFKTYKIIVAQILLTHHSFAIEEEKKSIIQIIDAYLKQGTIPIINENDLVCKEELEYKRMFTDNDILTALVGTAVKSDLVIILTDVDGLYKGNPKTNLNADLIENVDILDNSIKKMASADTNELGLGGMLSKVQAAEILTKQGITVLVANGKYKLADIIQNKVKRTVFTGKKA